MSVLASKDLSRERDRLAQNLPIYTHSVRPFYLTYEDVLDAHFCIADYFDRDQYGMSGVGYRDINLFVSTVERQVSHYTTNERDIDPFLTIATLAYGIVKNHPFYDANKRTSFLCSILQLHRMGRTISVHEKELEDILVEIADDSVLKRPAVRDLQRKGDTRSVISFLARYLQKNSRKNARLSNTIKYRDLRHILEQNGFSLRNAMKGYIDVVKTEEKKVHRFWRHDRIDRIDVVIGNIIYHGDGIDVPDNTLKHVRQLCGLTEQDGFDGEVLIRNAQPTFKLIASYRASLQNLAYR